MRRDRDRNVVNGDNIGFPGVFKKHDFDLVSSRESLLWEAKVKKGRRSEGKMSSLGTSVCTYCWRKKDLQPWVICLWHHGFT